MSGFKGNSIGYSLFPNPAADFITITVENQLLTNCEISLLNLQGRLVFAAKAQNPDQFTMDLSGLENGIYFVSVSDGQNKVMIRVVKQN